MVKPWDSCLRAEERLTGAADDAELQLGPAGKLVTQGDIFQSWNISILPNYTIVGLTHLGTNKTKTLSISSVRAHIAHVHTRGYSHRRDATGNWGLPLL